MNDRKGTIMFVLGLLALSLSLADRAFAKGGQSASPIAYTYVERPVPLAPEDVGSFMKRLDAQGAKGLRFVGTYTVTRLREPTGPTLVDVYASR